MYSVHFETIGCRLNQLESEAAAGAFAAAGFSVDMENASAYGSKTAQTVLCIVNTCTVTSKAEQKARRVIRLLLGKYPEAAVLVTGCYAEVEQAAVSALDERVAVLPGRFKDALSDIAEKLSSSLLTQHARGSISGAETARILRSLTGTVKEASPFRLSAQTFFKHSRASLKIQDGCANSCTYCRIRLARGEPVSLAASDVLRRVQALETVGYAEIVLTGVNLSQYRSVWNGSAVDIASLLGILLEHTSAVRFRISSLYPERVDSAFCSIAANERVTPFFHLSVQSGSDAVLRAMKRPYTASQVYDAAVRLREIKPAAFISCDIIAGFPGETDADFAQTFELCRACRFAWIHAFPFSARPGTEAYAMRPQVPQHIAGERVRRLTEFAAAQKAAYIRGCIGGTYWAVAESRKPDRLTSLRRTEAAAFATCSHAVTENFLHVRLTNWQEFRIKAGEAVRVLITAPAEKNSAGVDALAHIIEPIELQPRCLDEHTGIVHNTT